ncbi:hypothetical protein AAE478_008722 [Parahypoxylon ruwenzoriense]
MTDTILIEIPEGLGAKTLAATIVLCFFAIVSVALRLWVRCKIGANGTDDYLMVIGLMFFVACCIATTFGCFSGFGTTDNVINRLDPSGRMYSNGLKLFFIFQITYTWCLPFIKASVCVTLLRITKAKRYVIPLWAIMTLSTVTTFMGFVSVITQCTPVAASWDPSLGECDGTSRVGEISLAISAVSILTDWSCAVIPAFILWNLNMRLKVKLSLAFILSLGALASISTSVRLPYIEIYVHLYITPKDGLYHSANIVVWSIVECGIGIIAGSLPPLRPLFKKADFGFSAETMKTYANHLRCVADIHRRPGRGRSVQLGSVATPEEALTTTCQANQQHSPWWDQRAPNEVPSQKLVIVKNTRIDIEYDAPDATRPGTGRHG